MRWLLVLALSFAADVPGVINLDETTFKKIVNRKFTVLVKFDKQYPYGKAETVWKSVASKVNEASKDEPDFLLASVGVQDYGEKKNEKLAKLQGADTNWPVYKMYTSRGHISKFEGDATDEESLMAFIQADAGVWMGLSGTIAELAGIAERFIATTNHDSRHLIMHEAEVKAAALVETKPNLDASAKTYLKTMRKIMEKGDAFVGEEAARIKKILGGKISEVKKGEMQARLNILGAFGADHAESSKVRHSILEF